MNPARATGWLPALGRDDYVRGARITAALIAPAGIFIARGSATEAILAAIAGLYLGIVDPVGERLSVRLATGIVTVPGLIACLQLGFLINPLPLLVLLLVPLAAFAAGLANLFGPKVSPVSLFLLQALIVGAGMSAAPPLDEVLRIGLAGGGWAVLLTVLFAATGLEPVTSTLDLAGLWRRVRGAGARLHATLAQPSSRAFRHAARLALGIAAAEGLALFAQLPHGLWVPLTVALILKPDDVGTRQAAIERVTGSTGGGLVAALLAATLTSPWLQLAAMTPLAFASFTLLNQRYALGVACLTPTVILLLDLATPGEWQRALARVGDTAVAGIVALAMIALLPGRTEDEMP